MPGACAPWPGKNAKPYSMLRSSKNHRQTSEKVDIFMPFYYNSQGLLCQSNCCRFSTLLGERFELLGSVETINSQLIGTGSCIPDFVLTNAMLEQLVDTSDEWIVKRTGVRERRIAKNTHTWELALGAAQDALADAGIS